ncbi:MAG: hypothetical protein E7606_04245 [Ruminococcaceae bacterium]|nr:hypothetical protein [Oscillospiraceae bacterium]
MKFFHVYNDACFKGLEKNGLINKDTGFKIQQCWSVPEHLLFNKFAAKGTRLYNMIKEEKYPFYVDRLAGGATWYSYAYDKALIHDYQETLGKWFLGFQVHESGSNLRVSDWGWIRELGDGPYDLNTLHKHLMSGRRYTPEGIILYDTNFGDAYHYHKKTYAQTYEEFLVEMREMYERCMSYVDNSVVTADSYYLATKMQDEVGVKNFMPEVGCQIPFMRVAIALARGMAKATGKTWGTYYECWRTTPGHGSTMPCFNDDPINEWYVKQEMTNDNFSSYGKNGGSSRLLQNRIYYFSLMAGAQYLAEEWGLNCSYTDMKTFELSEYGLIKKNFINNALNMQGMEAKVPFAIVMPKCYPCVEISRQILNMPVGDNRGYYLNSPLNEVDTKYFGHLESIIKLFFAYNARVAGDNEDHVMTNSRFGDVADIIYEDASDETFARYNYLIDATPDGDFAKAKAGKGYKIVESGDLDKLEALMPTLIKETLPCYVDALHWLVSTDENGKRYLSIFNNSGNERDIKQGDIIHHEADRTVTVTFKEAVTPEKLVEGVNMPVDIQKIDDKTYKVNVPATSFVILNF